jgi:competence ComEA-like helix-hairpin-helix protein
MASCQNNQTFHRNGIFIVELLSVKKIRLFCLLLIIVQVQNITNNINTADVETLKWITGVGEVISQRIIDYREANGRFNSVEEMNNIIGIGDARFADLKDEITVD